MQSVECPGSVHQQSKCLVAIDRSDGFGRFSDPPFCQQAVDPIHSTENICIQTIWIPCLYSSWKHLQWAISNDYPIRSSWKREQNGKLWTEAQKWGPSFLDCVQYFVDRNKWIISLSGIGEEAATTSLTTVSRVYHHFPPCCTFLRDSGSELVSRVTRTKYFHPNDSLCPLWSLFLTILMH